MTDISKLSTAELRIAARVWRYNDVLEARNRGASGFLARFLPKPNLSLHDKIDDMIDEIDRLRRKSA